MARGAKTGERKQRSAINDVVAREYTIHLHTKVHNKGFKHRAPTAIKAVKEFAQKAMGTKKVLLAPELNAAIWARGVRSVPHRLRVRLQRRRNDDEDAEEKLFTYASFVNVKASDFKGLQTTVVDSEE
ncbi:hypothetical protein T439DRAFT_240164 [Meredithblackwellia eburnea MCA 4105]